MALSHSPSIISNNLILYLDAANPKSYVGAGTSWTDLIGSKTSTLTNGPTYDSSNLGSIVFDGLDDYVGGNSSLTLGSNFTISIWTKHSSLSNVQKYFSFGDFDRVLVQNNTNGNLNLYVDGYNQQNLFTWGYNNLGQLGINEVNNRSTPVTTILGGANWKSVSGGYRNTSAIKTDGTLWTWGYNLYGQLGINDTLDRSTPVTTILGGTNWKSVCSFGYFSSAIKTDGTLWTWGYNLYGQLGINNTTRRSTPVTTILGGTNWKSVVGGSEHTVAIKTDGTLWTWGRGTEGQLGINAVTNRSIPITTILGGTDWKFVDCGYQFTTAIKTDGTLWTWGYNLYGQLGINATTNRNTPVTTILGGTNWKSIANGFYHGTAIKTDGTLWTWGRNNFGQLGINNTANRSIPVTTFLGGTDWKSVSGGYNHTSSIKTDGRLWSWGNTDEGQLGINLSGLDINRITPITTILGGTNWKSVFYGFKTTLAIRTDTTFTNNLQVNSSLSNSTFYNIVATCDGTTLTLYQNGTSVSTAALGGTLNSIDGSFNISSELETFSGNLYSVMVYNKALTSTEIQQNFNALRGRFGI